MAATKSSSKKPTTGDQAKLLTEEERAAVKEAVKEAKAARSGKMDGEADVQAKFAEMNASDRAMAERIHAIVKDVAPELTPRTWYGMPAYAKDGKVVCFFTPAGKFKEPFASFGFQSSANLTDGNMWPMSWAVTKITDKEAARMAELIKQAVS